MQQTGALFFYNRNFLLRRTRLLELNYWRQLKRKYPVDSKMSVENLWTVRKTRDAFISYFVDQKGHVNVPSSPTIPISDPTLLFSNSGMNQVKTRF